MFLWKRTPREEILAQTNQTEEDSIQIPLISFFLMYRKYEDFQLFCFLRSIGKTIFNTRLGICSERNVTLKGRSYPMELSSIELEEARFRKMKFEGTPPLGQSFYQSDDKTMSIYKANDTTYTWRIFKTHKGIVFTGVDAHGNEISLDCYHTIKEWSEMQSTDPTKPWNSWDYTRFPFFIATEGLCSIVDCPTCSFSSATRVFANELEQTVTDMYQNCRDRAFDFVCSRLGPSVMHPVGTEERETGGWTDR